MDGIIRMFEDGHIDIAIALSLSVKEPERTISLNRILMQCIRFGDFPRSSKVAELLGRPLNNFELKAITKQMFSKTWVNFKEIQEVALKMSEPDKTNTLARAFDKCLALVFSPKKRDYEDIIINLASSMKESEKKKRLNDLIDFSLKEVSYFSFAEKVAKSLGKKFTKTELELAFTQVFKIFQENSTFKLSEFYELMSILKEMANLKKSKESLALREKSTDQLLAECFKKGNNTLILSVANLLEEPKKTGALNVVFNSIMENNPPAGKKDAQIALETAFEMCEPFKSENLNFFLEDYINSGLITEATAVCKMLGRLLSQDELFRIIEEMINQKNYDSARDAVQGIEDIHSQSYFLDRIFNGYIDLKHYGQAFATLKMINLKNDVSEKAKLLFNKMMATDKWLFESRDTALMMSEEEKPKALKRFEKRILKEGKGDYIVGIFRGRGLDEPEFKVFLKGYAGKILSDTEILKLCYVLSPEQKNDYLKLSVDRLMKNEKYDTALKITYRMKMTETESEEVYGKMRKVFVGLALFELAETISAITEVDFTEPELEIMLKKSLQEGLQEQAEMIAKITGTELNQTDLNIIMKKYIEEGKMNSAAQIAEKIISQKG